MNRKDFKIAVTSAGGGVGLSILKALQSVGYTTVALDADPLAVGLYASSFSYLIPHSKDGSYLKVLLAICKKEHCSVIYPGSDTELTILSQNKHLFDEIGVTAVVSDPDVIKLADDKLLTYHTLSKANLSVPITQTLTDFVTNPLIKYPLVLKPQVGGSRSLNVKRIFTQAEFDSIKNNRNFDASNTVVQEYIEGDEYTCGSVTLEKLCYGVIVMRRILRDGDTYKCFSERNEIIESFVKKVVEFIQPFGACNIQLRLKNAVPYVFEINARCSGTTAARALAGFNEPAAITDYLLLQKKPSFKIREISVLRYWKERVVNNEDIETLRVSKELTQTGIKPL